MAKKPARSTANDATVADAPAVSKPRGRIAKLNSQASGPPGDAFADPTDEEIRARAYEMYLERGGHHGLDFDDWVRAEHELKRRQ
jgi:hypothetical protein